MKDKYDDLYFMCLKDWSDEMKEAGDHKKIWYNKMKNEGLGVKLALNKKEEVVGMIQYIPIEYSFAEGEDLYYINCIWVHGYDEGVGNFQKKGIGTKLIKAAEEDVRKRGAKGIVAWGVSLPFWMKASWFAKQGYEKVDEENTAVLLWKPFSDNAIAPRWIKRKKKPEKIPGKVSVTAFLNGWCPSQNIVFERAKRAASEFGDNVVFTVIDTFNKDVFLEWGIADALFIDGNEVNNGPPPSYEDIKNKIDTRVKNLK